jgi:hypothetical protein
VDEARVLDESLRAVTAPERLHFFVTFLVFIRIINKKEIMDNKEIKVIIIKNYPYTIIKMKVRDLDKNHCSAMFLEHNFDPETIVCVKCDTKGNISYRGKKQEYRIFDVSKIKTL